MGCGCSQKGSKVRPINSGFLKGSSDTASYQYPSRTLNNIEVITPRLKFARTFADRINRKLLEGQVPDSLVSTGTDSRYQLTQNFLPFKPDKIVFNLNKVKHVRELSQPGQTESICSGSLTNAARNFYVRDSVSEFTFRRGEDAQRFTFNPNSRESKPFFHRVATNTNLVDELRRARREAGIQESTFSSIAQHPILNPINVDPFNSEQHTPSEFSRRDSSRFGS